MQLMHKIQVMLDIHYTIMYTYFPFYHPTSLDVDSIKTFPSYQITSISSIANQSIIWYWMPFFQLNKTKGSRCFEAINLNWINQWISKEVNSNLEIKFCLPAYYLCVMCLISKLVELRMRFSVYSHMIDYRTLIPILLRITVVK